MREKNRYMSSGMRYTVTNTRPLKTKKNILLLSLNCEYEKKKKSIFVRFHENFPTLKRMTRKRVRVGELLEQEHFAKRNYIRNITTHSHAHKIILNEYTHESKWK